MPGGGIIGNWQFLTLRPMHFGEPLIQGAPRAGYPGWVQEGGSSRRRRRRHPFGMSSTQCCPRPALLCCALLMCGVHIRRPAILKKASRGFELRSLGSESRVPTVTPRGLCSLVHNHFTNGGGGPEPAIQCSNARTQCRPWAPSSEAILFNFEAGQGPPQGARCIKHRVSSSRYQF
jgi:hypothetical protein